MSIVAVSFQTGVLSETFGDNLSKKTGWTVYTSKKMEQLLDVSRSYKPNIVLMEVAQQSPWDTAGCLKLKEKIAAELPECKFVLWCDERPGRVGDDVIRAKRSGQIDAFLFASADLEYFIAIMQSLLPDNEQESYA